MLNGTRTAMESRSRPPHMQQQKAHPNGCSQSYRHGWRRSSFNSSWFEKEVGAMEQEKDWSFVLEERAK